jgi:hypothetical protein
MMTGDIQELEVEAHVRRVRGPRRRSPDLSGGERGPESAGLSTAQLHFARQHGATAGANSEVLEAVFFYRIGSHRTERWLVNSEGQVLDHAFLS